LNCYFCKKDITKDLECIECQSKNKFTKLTNNVDFDKLNKVDTSITVMENTEKLQSPQKEDLKIES